jgi:hypothetical protein
MHGQRNHLRGPGASSKYFILPAKRRDRKGQYHVAKLIERRGPDTKLLDWKNVNHGGLPKASQVTRGADGFVRQEAASRSDLRSDLKGCQPSQRLRNLC